MFDISGKVALITGASRGIGKATAIQLAKSGARVVVSSRKQIACEEVVHQIRAAGGEAVAMASTSEITSSSRNWLFSSTKNGAASTFWSAMPQRTRFMAPSGTCRTRRSPRS